MLAFLDRPRLPFILLLGVCSALLGYGLYLQAGGGLNPCPMCIMQRYAFVGIILIALAAAIHRPRGKTRKAYGLALLAAALAGGGVALRQSWIQRFPPEFAECGPDLEFMLDSFPLKDALPLIFQGSGDCTAIDWSFLGLSIANWSLACFALIAVLSLIGLFRKA
ncbi:MAG: disulfide bond formation protein B [Rhodocyclaceae bacterium]|jgi:disulfide bond formation protein DsbB|nr:disulfide bond formation protein B [Rhodocyclaceae bacterium]